jgi:hypothetical protein
MSDDRLRLAVVIAGLAWILGCGTSSPPTAAVESDNKTPEAVTGEFLEAMRSGDENKAAALLTAAARTRTAEKDMFLAPPGSETARFAVREVMLVEQGAHVATDWTDVDADGHMHTDRIVWLLRNEPEGWRIAGMATKIFPDRAPVVLNFEDPDDMVRQRQLADEEMARRQGSAPSEGAEDPEASLRQ